MHLERQQMQAAMLERLAASDRPWQLAVAELMTDAERTMAEHWAQVEQVAAGAQAADGAATRRG
jgi:hypothetical protein